LEIRTRCASIETWRKRICGQSQRDDDRSSDHFPPPFSPFALSREIEVDKREGGGMGFMPNESHETGDVGSGGEKRTGRTAMREEGKEK